MIGRFCEVKSDQKALRRRRHVEPVSIPPRDNKLRSIQKFLKAKSEASRTPSVQKFLKAKSEASRQRFRVQKRD